MSTTLNLEIFYNNINGKAIPASEIIDTYHESAHETLKTLEHTIASESSFLCLKLTQKLFNTSSELGGIKILEYLEGIEAMLISENPDCKLINLKKITRYVSELVITCTKVLDNPLTCALLIDDSRMPLILSSKLLEDNNIKTYTASSGYEGVETFKNFISEIDIVITDLFMPDINGDEVYNQIKAHSPDTIVLLATGYNELDANKGSRIDFADGCIKKPLSYSKLLEALSPLMDHK